MIYRYIFTFIFLSSTPFIAAQQEDFDRFVILKAMSNDKEACNELIDGGLDPNHLFNGERSMLHHTVDYDNVNLCHHLLDRGADINLRDSDGFTPLATAVWGNRTDVVRDFVFNRGADLDAEVHWLGKNRTIRQLAAWKEKELYNHWETPLSIIKEFDEQPLIK